MSKNGTWKYVIGKAAKSKAIAAAAISTTAIEKLEEKTQRQSLRNKFQSTITNKWNGNCGPNLEKVAI